MDYDANEEMQPASSSVPIFFPELLLDCSKGDFTLQSKLPAEYRHLCHLAETDGVDGVDRALRRDPDVGDKRAAAVWAAHTNALEGW